MREQRVRSTVVDGVVGDHGPKVAPAGLSRRTSLMALAELLRQSQREPGAGRSTRGRLPRLSRVCEPGPFRLLSKERLESSQTVTTDFAQLLGIAKTLPEELSWEPHDTHPYTWTAESGLMDESGKHLAGAVCSLAVRSPQHKHRWEIWTFQIHHRIGRFSTTDVIYRLDLNKRPGQSAGDHDWPHEHRLGVRTDLAAAAYSWTWAVAFRYFALQTNIINPPTLGHPVDDFKLT